MRWIGIYRTVSISKVPGIAYYLAFVGRILTAECHRQGNPAFCYIRIQYYHRCLIDDQIHFSICSKAIQVCCRDYQIVIIFFVFWYCSCQYSLGIDGQPAWDCSSSRKCYSVFQFVSWVAFIKRTRKICAEGISNIYQIILNGFRCGFSFRPDVDKVEGIVIPVAIGRTCPATILHKILKDDVFIRYDVPITVNRLVNSQPQ